MVNEKDSVNVYKSNGDFVAKCDAEINGHKILIYNSYFGIVDRGYKISRYSNTGDEELFIVTSIEAYGDEENSHDITKWNPYLICQVVKAGDNSALEKRQNIQIHNAQSVQIGDHNTANISNSFQSLINEINNSNATPEQKTEAKSRLKAVIESPLFNTILGSSAAALIAML